MKLNNSHLFFPFEYKEKIKSENRKKDLSFILIHNVEFAKKSFININNMSKKHALFP